MKYRMVPRIIYSSMMLNDGFKYKWANDRVISLIGLGTSFLLEFFEYYGDALSRRYQEIVSGTPFEDDRFETFISQERRHAAAHKKLNLFVTKAMSPPRRERYHPRVYDFMYPTYKSFVEPLMSGIEADLDRGRTLDGAYFIQALKTIAVFETEVYNAALSFFASLFDKGRLDAMMDLSENLGILYLLGYHYVEEIEHCHVSIETYERISGSQLWTEDEIIAYEGTTCHLHDRIINATLFAARELGVDVTHGEICSRLPPRKNIVSPGFTAREPETAEKIGYLIDRWDNEWEPKLLRRIEALSAPTDQPVRATNPEHNKVQRHETGPVL